MHPLPPKTEQFGAEFFGLEVDPEFASLLSHPVSSADDGCYLYFPLV